MTCATHFALLFAIVVGCASSRVETRGPAPQGVEERVVRIAGEGGALRVSDGGAGAGSPVIFVHGLGSDIDVWRAQLAFVRASGRRAIAYDQRGHGQSERPADGAYSIDALARDLEAVRRSLDIPRVVLVGHSISGDVVTSYAAAHPERVAGIVYADAVGDFESLPRERREKVVREDAGFSLAQWQADWAAMLGANARPTTRQQVLASLERVDLRALAALRKDSLFLPARELAARYRGPRWAIEVDDPAGAEMRASALDPTIHLVSLPRVSHWLMLDDPAAFNLALGQALAAMP